MATVTVRGLSKRFGASFALHPTDLEIADGEFVVIVGPSGCGKSTLLRLIAGLEEPSGGQVLIGDRDVTDAAPADRGLAMVFQSYALYPHLSVAENIAFPLKVARISKAEVQSRVAAVAEALDLTALLARRPAALSGGQRQRVSIARGSTRTYQFNGIWAPVDDISFRGSYGQSVRAPNIAEVFRPRTGDSSFLSDPCYLGTRGDGTQYREANCQALITAAGGNPATFNSANNSNANINIPGARQGNPDLKAETARTWTAGVVLRPSFVPRLQIAVDWYDIRLKNAINTASASDIAALCVDQPTTDNPFCATIQRQAGTGYISSYVVQPENVAAFRTSGLELNASYQIETGKLGSFDVRLIGGYLHRLEQIPTIGADVDNNRDLPFRPKYNLTFSPTWSLANLTVNYNLRWQNGVRRFDRAATADNASYVDPRYFRFKALWQHDVRFQYEVAKDFAFYAGVNNFTNQKPDIGFETNVPISPVGRFFYAGARVTLDRR